MSDILRAVSKKLHSRDAAAEIAEKLGGVNLAAAMVFCSAEYDLEALQSELTTRLSGTELLGCTTAGEISQDGYESRSIVAIGFPSDAYVVVTNRVDDLQLDSFRNISEMVRSLLRDLRIKAPDARPSEIVAVLLIDGLSGAEEAVVSAIAMELGDIPLVGGSAGDNLHFEKTQVLSDGHFRSGRAALALIHTHAPLLVFKTQHIRSTGVHMVVTAADPGKRVVTEINAEPAAEEYGRLCGVEGTHFRSSELALHPLLVRVGGENYARTVKSVNDDKSLTFYCAIDEGIVLTSGLSDPIEGDLEQLFAGIRQAIGVPEAVLGFDCLFRRLTLQEQHLDRCVSEMFAENNVVGFSTYGEQFNAMHLNLTFTGVAFGSNDAFSE